MIRKMCLLSQILNFMHSVACYAKRKKRCGLACNYCNDGFFFSVGKHTCLPCDTCGMSEKILVNCSKTENTKCASTASLEGLSVVTPDLTLFAFSIIVLCTGIILLSIFTFRTGGLCFKRRRISKSTGFLNDSVIFNNNDSVIFNNKTRNRKKEMNKMNIASIDIEKMYQKKSYDETLNCNITANLHQDKETQTFLNSHFNLNIMNAEWDSNIAINQKGGQLKIDGSDIQLTIPNNSISSEGQITVYGSVYTDFQQIYDKFDIDDDQFLISPVVEFSLGDLSFLNKHAVIAIPHCATGDLSSIRIQWFSSKSIPGEMITLYDIKNQSAKSNSQFLDSYYELADGYILIYSRHFSGFVCTQCKKEVKMTLYVTVFGSYRFKGTRFGEWNLDIRAYIHDQRSTMIKDFQTALEKKELECERKLLDRRPFCRNPCDHLKVSMELQLSEEEESVWSYKKIGQFIFTSKQDKSLEKILTCPDHDPQDTIDWILYTKDNFTPDEIQCVLFVNCTQRIRGANTKLIDAVKIFLQLKKQENQKKYSRLISDNKETFCEVLKDNLDLDRCVIFCKLMGLTDIQIDQIKRSFMTTQQAVDRLIQTCIQQDGVVSFKNKTILALQHMKENLILSRLDYIVNMPFNPDSNSKHPIQATDNMGSLVEANVNDSPPHHQLEELNIGTAENLDEQYGVQCNGTKSNCIPTPLNVNVHVKYPQQQQQLLDECDSLNPLTFNTKNDDSSEEETCRKDIDI